MEGADEDLRFVVGDLSWPSPFLVRGKVQDTSSLKCTGSADNKIQMLARLIGVNIK